MFSMKQQHLLFDQKGSFRRFPQHPAEIRNQIWKISVQLYPARIVDLREYRLSAPGILSPTEAIAPESSTASRPNEVQDKIEEKDVQEIVGFKSRALPPNLLYICRDSMNFAKESYTKAFGTVDMPAETWIDFKKDKLYLTWDFCRLALEGFAVNSHVVHPTGQTVPHDCFFKELKQENKQVRDLSFEALHPSDLGDWWWGLQPYPWVEFGTLVERQLGCTTSSIAPRRTDSRCAAKKMRERTIPERE